MTLSYLILSFLWAYGNLVVHKALGFSAIDGAFEVIELPCVDFRTRLFHSIDVSDVLLIPGAVVVEFSPRVAAHIWRVLLLPFRILYIW